MTFWAVANVIAGGVRNNLIYSTREQAARAFAQEVRSFASNSEAEAFVATHQIIILTVAEEPSSRRLVA